MSTTSKVIYEEPETGLATLVASNGHSKSVLPATQEFQVKQKTKKRKEAVEELEEKKVKPARKKKRVSLEDQMKAFVAESKAQVIPRKWRSVEQQLQDASAAGQISSVQYALLKRIQDVATEMKPDGKVGVRCWSLGAILGQANMIFKDEKQHMMVVQLDESHTQAWAEMLTQWGLTEWGELEAVGLTSPFTKVNTTKGEAYAIRIKHAVEKRTSTLDTGEKHTDTIYIEPDEDWENHAIQLSVKVGIYVAMPTDDGGYRSGVFLKAVGKIRLVSGQPLMGDDDDEDDEEE